MTKNGTSIFLVAPARQRQTQQRPKAWRKENSITTKSDVLIPLFCSVWNNYVMIAK